MIASACLLSACTTAASRPPAASQPASASASVTAPAAAAPSATPAGTTTPGTRSLRIAADIDLGAGAGQNPPVIAEAADGTVFYAAGQVVMVIGANGAPVAAEHVGAKVLALGASTSALYVVTARTLIAYGRSSGNQLGSWPLTASPATPTTAGIVVGGDGTVWVWTDWATDASGYEDATVYAVPSGAGKAVVISRSAQPGSLVTDGTHGYFLVSSSTGLGASVVEAMPAPANSGTPSLVTVGAAPAMALAGFSQSQALFYQQSSSLYY